METVLQGDYEVISKGRDYAFSNSLLNVFHYVFELISHQCF